MGVGLHRLHAQTLQVLNRSRQTDALRDRRRASLKFPGEIIPASPLKGHLADHVTAVEERLHLFQDAAFAIQPANTGWTEHFMAGEGKKITVQGAHVNWHVGNTLGPVYTQ